MRKYIKKFMATGLFLDMIYHQTFRHYVIHVADLT
jgi:hypothetical protein